MSSFNQRQIEDEMLKVSDEQEDLVRKLKELGDQAATARVTFKVQHARVFLNSKGTVGERNARADALTEEQALASEISTAREKYLRAAIDTKSRRLDVLRSVNGNLRSLVS